MVTDFSRDELCKALAHIAVEGLTALDTTRPTQLSDRAAAHGKLIAVQKLASDFGISIRAYMEDKYARRWDEEIKKGE